MCISRAEDHRIAVTGFPEVGQKVNTKFSIFQT